MGASARDQFTTRMNAGEPNAIQAYQAVSDLFLMSSDVFRQHRNILPLPAIRKSRTSGSRISIASSPTSSRPPSASCASSPGRTACHGPGPTAISEMIDAMRTGNDVRMQRSDYVTQTINTTERRPAPADSGLVDGIIARNDALLDSSVVEANEMYEQSRTLP